MIKVFYTILLATAFLAPILLRANLEVDTNLAIARNKLNNTEQVIDAYRQSLTWSLLSRKQVAQEFYDFCQNQSLEKKSECFWQLKAGIQGSRSFLFEHLPILDQVERQIEILNPKPEKYLELVNKPKINFKFQILAQICFWAWIFSTVFFILKSFDRDANFIKKNRVLILPVMIFYFSWLICLAQA